MKKPWYIWLSVIGFLIISYQCRISLLHNAKKRDYNLWFRFNGKVLCLWGLGLMIPICFMLFIFNVIQKINYFGGLGINIVILIYTFFCGVIISGKLYDWKRENIK